MRVPVNDNRKTVWHLSEGSPARNDPAASAFHRRARTTACGGEEGGAARETSRNPRYTLLEQGLGARLRPTCSTGSPARLMLTCDVEREHLFLLAFGPAARGGVIKPPKAGDASAPTRALTLSSPTPLMLKNSTWTSSRVAPPHGAGRLCGAPPDKTQTSFASSSFHPRFSRPRFRFGDSTPGSWWLRSRRTRRAVWRRMSNSWSMIWCRMSGEFRTCANMMSAASTAAAKHVLHPVPAIAGIFCLWRLCSWPYLSMVITIRRRPRRIQTGWAL